MTAADGVEHVLAAAERNATVRRVGVWVLGALGFLALLAVARCDGRRAERSDAALHAAKDTLKRAEVVRERIVDTVRLATAARVRVETRTVALHDSVTIRDTVTLVVRVAGDSVVRVEVPAVVVRRIQADSGLIEAQRGEIVALHRAIEADSGVIHGMRIVNAATPRRHWYDGRVSIGPSASLIVGSSGVVRAGIGVSVTVALVRWP